MAFTVQSVIDRFASLVQDTANVRWSQSDIVKMINDGQREAVIQKPEVCVKTAPMILVANTTKQSLPPDGVMLINVVRNMGADGVTAGDAISIVSQQALNASRPQWHSDASSGKVKNYTFDVRIPKQFYIYPKAPATALYVELSYSALPTDAVYVADNANNGALGIDDIYVNALIHYLFYAAYARDSEITSNAALATAHYNAFLQALGSKTQVEMAYNPNASVALQFTQNLPSASSIK